MGPPESARESAGEPSGQRDPGLPLTEPAPSGAEEESADATATGANGRGRCGRCLPSPCGSRAEPEAKKKAPCPGLGLFYTLLSAFLFSVASLFVKKVQDVHAVEISAFRCVFQMLVIIPCLIYRNHIAVGEPRPLGEVQAVKNGDLQPTVCTNLSAKRVCMLRMGPPALRLLDIDHQIKKSLERSIPSPERK
ncbi:solute carrier family 35 member G1 isoform X3 [Cavia porcellus]|uniref:solute carrier family 35 member G1 isoform X3 n=1 Tax=Cavia porcellus TaxID=10141 RepID=UPI002FE23F71